MNEYWAHVRRNRTVVIVWGLTAAAIVFAIRFWMNHMPLLPLFPIFFECLSGFLFGAWIGYEDRSKNGIFVSRILFHHSRQQSIRRKQRIARGLVTCWFIGGIVGIIEQYFFIGLLTSLFLVLVLVGINQLIEVADKGGIRG
jgi:hypothetical protein